MCPFQRSHMSNPRARAPRSRLDAHGETSSRAGDQDLLRPARAQARVQYGGTEAHAADWLKLFGYLIVAAFVLFVVIFAAIPTVLSVVTFAAIVTTVTAIVWESKWSARLAQPAKALITAAAWIAGVIAVVVVLSNINAAPIACFDIANQPIKYVSPNNDTACPIGFEPRQACAVNASADSGLMDTGGCPNYAVPFYWSHKVIAAANAGS